MPTYVLLTKLSPEATREPISYQELVDSVRQKLRKDCPQVKWLANYWLLGPYDYLDIYEALNEEVATKVLLSYGPSGSRRRRRGRPFPSTASWSLWRSCAKGGQ